MWTGEGGRRWLGERGEEGVSVLVESRSAVWLGELGTSAPGNEETTKQVISTSLSHTYIVMTPSNVHLPYGRRS